MVQDRELVRDWDACRVQLGDRSQDAAFAKIALRIVISADNQDPSVLSPRNPEEVVHVLEMVVSP